MAVLQEKVSSLTIMCVKSDKCSSVSFQHIINDFALKKSRKIKF
jgi:hypothetical protein